MNPSLVCISFALVLASIPPQASSAFVESVEQTENGEETETESDKTEKSSEEISLEAEVLKPYLGKSIFLISWLKRPLYQFCNIST